MHKIITKTLKKLFSSFGVAALAAVFAIAGTVFAATNWTTWVTDMTKVPGDALTSSSWNKMVAAIGEDHSTLATTTTTANTALTNAATAQTSAERGNNEINLGNGVGYIQCGGWSGDLTGAVQSAFWIDRTNKKVYVKSNYNSYAAVGNGTQTSVGSKTENTYLSALFSAGDILSINCASIDNMARPFAASATVKASDGTIKTYIWGLLYNTSYGYFVSYLNSTAGMVNLDGSGNYGYLVPTLVAPI